MVYIVYYSLGNPAGSREDAGQGTLLELIQPSLFLTVNDDARAVPSTSTYSSASMPSSAESSSDPPVHLECSRGYCMAHSLRCHTELQLLCLGNRSHTEQRFFQLCWEKPCGAHITKCSCKYLPILLTLWQTQACTPTQTVIVQQDRCKGVDP